MSWDPVYRLIKKIPRGRVTTYGELARALRLPGGARAVGYAMAATPSGRGIPWHRVIGAGGRIRVPEPYASKQRKMLETEGIALDGGVIDMKAYGWSPAKRKPNRPKRRKKVGRSR
jgi:methylated-DNA-protein-cysteine methyltransferase related protein